jgi:DEP domain-containing protein 5
MYLLPKEDPIMRKIMEENIEHCDIYTRDNSPIVQKTQIEEFLRLVETHLNKIKRVKKPRVSNLCKHVLILSKIEMRF